MFVGGIDLQLLTFTYSDMLNAFQHAQHKSDFYFYLLSPSMNFLLCLDRQTHFISVFIKYMEKEERHRGK